MLRSAPLIRGIVGLFLAATVQAQPPDSPPLLSINVSLTANEEATADPTTTEAEPAAFTPTPEGPPPMEAVRKVLDGQIAAWNRGDLETFMQGYWSSQDLTFFSGAARTRGWQATLDRYRVRYQQEGQPMGKLSFPSLDIQPLGSDAAFVRGEWQLVRGNETLGGLFTLIFRRLDGGWKVVHDHTSAR